VAFQPFAHCWHGHCVIDWQHEVRLRKIVLDYELFLLEMK